MLLFMDMHNRDGPVSIGDVAKAHAGDLRTQGEFGVQYLRYWVDEPNGKIFCLVDKPDAETARAVHRKALGWSRTRFSLCRKAVDRRASTRCCQQQA